MSLAGVEIREPAAANYVMSEKSNVIDCQVSCAK